MGTPVRTKNIYNIFSLKNRWTFVKKNATKEQYDKVWRIDCDCEVYGFCKQSN